MRLAERGSWGHARLERTDRYLQSASDQLAAIQERVSPMDRIDVRPMKVPKRRWHDRPCYPCRGTAVASKGTPAPIQVSPAIWTMQRTQGAETIEILALLACP